MHMKNTITITRKGQTTIPAPLRRKLGLDANGGVLDIHFDDKKGELVVSKPLSIDELANKLSSYIKQGAKPLVDADAYYQTDRKSRK
jgi:AbrB family looped-hinge helix DNA binding protein